MTKVLQNISNDVKSSKKEPFMNDLDSGGRWQSMLYDWFEEIVNVRYNPQSIHERVTETPVTMLDLHLMHSLVFKYRAQLSSAFDTNDRTGPKLFLAYFTFFHALRCSISFWTVFPFFLE